MLNSSCEEKSSTHLSRKFLICSLHIDLNTRAHEPVLPKGSIATKVIGVLFRILACIYFLFEGLFRKIFKMEMAEMVEEANQTVEYPNSNCQEQNTQQSTEELIHPCCQKLQHLEKLVSELTKKPAKIPPEKDEILLESMSRIKSIEYDLQKTRKVSYVCFLNSNLHKMLLRLVTRCSLTLSGIACDHIETS